jgi:hypothetical protein
LLDQCNRSGIHNKIESNGSPVGLGLQVSRDSRGEGYAEVYL